MSFSGSISHGRKARKVGVSSLAWAVETIKAQNLNPRPGWQVEFRWELKVCGNPPSAWLCFLQLRLPIVIKY